jgi:hypothetical protein
MFWSWVAEALASLSGCEDDIFRKFWNRRRLRFTDLAVDDIDKYNTRLVSAAIRRREDLFIVLPDFQRYRPALLFATALIRYCRDSRQQLTYKNTQHSLRVVYFGSTVGIREQLRQVKIGDRGKNLADLFPQEYLGRRNAIRMMPSKIRSQKFNLPEVVTIYAPVDPIAVVEQYQPEWIAIDCGDTEKFHWLLPLLQNAAQKNIPVIAWGQNPLSGCLVNFSRYSQVFKWSAKPSLKQGFTAQIQESIKNILQESTITEIQPFVLEGIQAHSLSVSFQRVNYLLASCTRDLSGHLDRDTLRLHWQYLRSLESLAIPFEFYEAESKHFWGMKSFEQLQNDCEQFRNACYQSYPDIAIKLEEVNALLEVASEQIKTNGSPMWFALCNFLEEEPSTGEARIITFTSKARKQLFLLTLLALNDRTEEELRLARTWVFSLDELDKLLRQQNQLDDKKKLNNSMTIDKTLDWHPLIVGLPNFSARYKLLPTLIHKKLDILIHHHQTSALAYQTDEWSKKLTVDLSGITTVLSKFSGIIAPQELPKIPSRIRVNELIGLDAISAKKTKYSGAKLLWEPDDPVTEVARLLQSDEQVDENELITIGSIQTGIAKPTGGVPESWCKSAVEVHFDQGWYTCFAPDETIKIIGVSLSNHKTDERYVRSLKPGDRVVAIPGQRRQSLYDLIISRVHGHPSIELHLALIRRWQEDFMAAYKRWQQYGVRNLEELLSQMQERGSSLTSSFTLRQWLWGNTLCPDDPDDLYRLAELLDMDFVRSYYRRIFQAAKRLRGLHRALSRRLNSWLEQEATGWVGKNDRDLIDAELGLTFSDFRNSLLILRVEEVQIIKGLFLRDSLGKFERNI